MQDKELSLENRFILNCATTAMDNESYSSSLEIIKKGLDWNRVFETAKFHNVAPLMYPNLKALNNSQPIPEDILHQFRKINNLTGIRNAKLYNELKIVLREFKENGIDVILLKGATLALLIYKNISLRPMSDIDILVKKDDAQKIKKILIEKGYKEDLPYPREYFFKILPYFPSFLKEYFSIDVKWEIYYFSKIKSTFVNLRSRAKKIMINEIPALCLSIEDQLLLSYSHLLKHAPQNEEQLLWYCDLAEILKNRENNIDWNYISNDFPLPAVSNGLYKFLLDLGRYFPISLYPPEQGANSDKHKLDFNPQKLLIRKRNEKNTVSRFITVINKIKMISNINHKILYLFGCLFPGKAFLIQRYKIKNSKLVPLYSLLRPLLLLFEIF